MAERCNKCGKIHMPTIDIEKIMSNKSTHEERFIDGKCRYCKEPQNLHHPEMCGYDKCKGEGCELWILRPSNCYQLCDLCTLKHAARMETRIAADTLFKNQMQEALGCDTSTWPIWFGVGLLERAKTLVQREATLDEVSRLFDKVSHHMIDSTHSTEMSVTCRVCRACSEFDMVKSTVVLKHETGCEYERIRTLLSLYTAK